MKKNNVRNFIVPLVLLCFFPSFIFAEDIRTLPLDMNLIIDGSAAFENSRSGAFAWINEQVVDRILMDGDTISIWLAGDSAELVYSDTVSAAGKGAIKTKIQELDTSGESADFAGALGEAASRISRTGDSTISYTMLITASAQALAPALTGASQNLFRWSRSEWYERWQVLVVAPNISGRVRQAASDYMSTNQRGTAR